LEKQEARMEFKGEARHPAAVIVFTIITCGIYALVWEYKFSKEIKAYLGNENINPGLEVFLSFICFPYIIYWSYKTGKLMTDIQKKASLPQEDNSVLYLVLALFGFFIVNMAILQDSINKVWAEKP
jgi:hypothetical protein